MNDITAVYSLREDGDYDLVIAVYDAAVPPDALSSIIKTLKLTDIQIQKVGSVSELSDVLTVE